jgi:hypothetical protein
MKAYLSLRLIHHHSMETYGGTEAELHAFLISALDGGQWSPSRPGRSNPEDGTPVFKGGLRARLNSMGKSEEFLFFP